MNEPAAGERYWSTSVSKISPDSVTVRGYPLEQLIGISFTTASYLMIRGKLPTPQEASVLDAVLTGILDYGLEKAGTVAARHIVSVNPSMEAGLAAAVLGAGEFAVSPEKAAAFISQTYDNYAASGSEDMNAFAAKVVAEARQGKLRIPGFGHPVFKHVDPRGEVLRSIAVDAGLWGPPAQLYEAVHRAFIHQPGKEHFPINDVGVMAAITVALGFTPKEAAALAVIGTLPGVVAHISEELASGQGLRAIPQEQVDYDVPNRELAADMARAGWTND